MGDSKVQCPHCKYAFESQPSPGTTITCAACGKPFEVPAAPVVPEMPPVDAQVKSEAAPPSHGAGGTASNANPGPTGSAAPFLHSPLFLDPDSYRYPGEHAVLFGILTVLGGVFGLLFLAAPIYVGMFVIGLALATFAMKQIQANFIGNCVAVSETQFQRIHRLAARAAFRLATPMPRIYLRQDPMLQANALGFFSSPSVAVTSGLVEAMTDEELMYVIGHELSHVKCSHTTWNVLTGGSQYVRLPVFSWVLEKVFLLYNRKAEYTCDRGGLIACGNLNTAISATAKLLTGKLLYDQLDLAALLKQKTQFDESVMAKVNEVLLTHPSTVNRLHRLRAFADSDSGRMLIARSDSAEAALNGRPHPVAECVNNYMPWSIFSVCFLSAVPGLVAMSYSFKVDKDIAAGDRDAAEQAKKAAFNWNIVSTCLGGVFWGLVVLIWLRAEM
jgi:Zn-dependent protease with chaperone function